MKKYRIVGAYKVKSIEDINTRSEMVYAEGGDMMQVSDGYHTMDELYQHRVALFITLCRKENTEHREYVERMAFTQGFAFNSEDWPRKVWRSKYHADGELCFGTGTQFVLGIGKEKGEQITYHIPIALWDETDFAEILNKAPEWDGHTPADVLERLKNL